MNKLIYITGGMDSFFTNEIDALVKAFDDVLVLTYNETPDTCAQLSREHGFRSERIKAGLPDLKEIHALLRWLKSDHVRVETGAHIHGAHALKKYAYLLLYGLFAIRVDEMLKREQKLLDEQVYFYSFWLSRGGYAVALLSRKYSAVKAVSRAHGYDLYLNRNELNYLPFRRYIAEHLDAIYFISGNGKNYFEDMCRSGGFRAPNMEVIHLGTFERRPLPQRAPGTAIVLASCSTLNSLKRLDLIIRLVREVSVLCGDVQWFHIGDGELMDATRALAEKEIPGKYELLGWHDNEEIFSIYARRRPHFFINLSDSEGIPVSIMEALSMGIPAVARNVGGNSEIVRDGVNGFLLPEAVDDELLRETACRLVELCKATAAHQAYSQAAVAYWNAEFNAEKNSALFAEKLKMRQNK